MPWGIIFIMGNAKNYYNELKKDGTIIKVQATSRDMDEIHSAIKGFAGYRKINDYTIELNVDGVNKKAALLRMVPEGNHTKLDTKRVQYNAKWIKGDVELILVVYKVGDCIIYLTSSELKSLIEPTKSVTTLLRVDLSDLAASFKKDVVVIKNVPSRGHRTNILISRDLNNLFSYKEEDDHFDFDFSLNLNTQEINLSAKGLDDSLELDAKNHMNADAEVGYAAEQMFSKEIFTDDDLKEEIYKKTNHRIENTVWMNEFEEQYRPYDFLDQNKLFIEIKGSKNEGSFFMSDREYGFGNANNMNYIIVKYSGFDVKANKYKKRSIYKIDEVEIESTHVVKTHKMIGKDNDGQ